MVKNVTPRQHKAIVALLTTSDVASAAKDAGVSRNTLYRWLKDPVFRRALIEAESDAISNLSRGLVALGDLALKTLHDAMTDDQVVTGSRIRAADVCLSRLLEIRQLFTLESRVTDLENRANNGKFTASN